MKMNGVGYASGTKMDGGIVDADGGGEGAFESSAVDDAGPIGIVCPVSEEYAIGKVGGPADVSEAADKIDDKIEGGIVAVSIVFSLGVSLPADEALSQVGRMSGDKTPVKVPSQ